MAKIDVAYEELRTSYEFVFYTSKRTYNLDLRQVKAYLKLKK